MSIAQPMTVATDAALAAGALVWAGLLLRQRSAGSPASRDFWALAFAATGIAALAGAMFHGWHEAFGAAARAVLWKTVVVGIGLAAFGMLSGVIVATLTAPWRARLLALTQLKLVVYLAWVSAFDDFRYALSDYVPALLLVLVLAVQAAHRRRAPGSAWIAVGVLTSLAGASVQVGKLSLHPNFNHNDLYHLMQLLALWLFYRGARVAVER